MVVDTAPCSTPLTNDALAALRSARERISAASLGNLAAFAAKAVGSIVKAEAPWVMLPDPCATLRQSLAAAEPQAKGPGLTRWANSLTVAFCGSDQLDALQSAILLCNPGTASFQHGAGQFWMNPVEVGPCGCQDFYLTRHAVLDFFRLVQKLLSEGPQLWQVVGFSFSWRADHQ